LNVHTEALDCGVCHLHGRDLVVRRFRGEEAVTRETLAQAPGGRLYAARKANGRWVRILRPEQGTTLKHSGAACKECHRRGSTFLRGEGLYDDYRLRILEDLAVLRRVAEGTL